MAQVFGNDKERIKAAVRAEMENVCAMVDSAGDSPSIHYAVDTFGVRVVIVVDITERSK